MKKGIATAMGWSVLSLFLFWSFWSGPVLAQPGRYKGQTLRVATFGGDYLKWVQTSIGDPLAKETGAEVKYVVGGPATHLSKMIASKGQEPPFDIADLTPDAWAEALKQGLLEKVDLDRIPNLKKVFTGAFLEPGRPPVMNWAIV